MGSALVAFIYLFIFIIVTIFFCSHYPCLIHHASGKQRPREMREPFSKTSYLSLIPLPPVSSACLLPGTPPYGIDGAITSREPAEIK